MSVSSIFLLTVEYITSDPFFWASMALTVMVGIFIGAVIYDGDGFGLKNGLIFLISYFALLTATNLSRVLPELSHVALASVMKPLASVTASLFVTVFYLLGMSIGVMLIRQVRRNLRK